MPQMRVDDGNRVRHARRQRPRIHRPPPGSQGKMDGRSSREAALRALHSQDVGRVYRPTHTSYTGLTHVPIFPDKASTQYAAPLRTHQEQDRSKLREQTGEELPAMTTPKTPTHPFERSHSIVIAAAPEAVF